MKGCYVQCCLELHETTFKHAVLFILPVEKNHTLLCQSCTELPGLSFSLPLQLLHCHFPIAGDFTIPKLIGFVHITHTFTQTHMGMSKHTDKGVRGTRAANRSQPQCNEKQSTGNSPIVLLQWEHIILLHANLGNCLYLPHSHHATCNPRQNHCYCISSWQIYHIWWRMSHSVMAGILINSHNQCYWRCTHSGVREAFMEQQGAPPGEWMGTIMITMAPYSGTQWWGNGNGWKSLLFRFQFMRAACTEAIKQPREERGG